MDLPMVLENIPNLLLQEWQRTCAQLPKRKVDLRTFALLRGRGRLDRPLLTTACKDEG